MFDSCYRSNLDPFEEHDDATLHDALKRSWLIEQDSHKYAVEGADEGDKVDSGSSTPSKPRFTLDLQIEDEGQNLSVGERSLVSLARALVKNSKIIILECVTGLRTSLVCPSIDAFGGRTTVKRLLRLTLRPTLASKKRSVPNSRTRP